MFRSIFGELGEHLIMHLYLRDYKEPPPGRESPAAAASSSAAHEHASGRLAPLSSTLCSGEPPLLQRLLEGVLGSVVCSLQERVLRDLVLSHTLAACARRVHHAPCGLRLRLRSCFICATQMCMLVACVHLGTCRHRLHEKLAVTCDWQRCLALRAYSTHLPTPRPICPSSALERLLLDGSPRRLFCSADGPVLLADVSLLQRFFVARDEVGWDGEGRAAGR